MADTKVIVIPDGKICDYIDSKFRNDTPEEYVRQTIEKRLVNEHKYLTSQIKIEWHIVKSSATLSENGLQRVRASPGIYGDED